MKARSLINVMVCLAGLATVATAQAQDVVISAVYGGGGNAGAQIAADFIELKNRTGAPINLAGYSVQYASTAGSSWTVTSLTGTIPANGYFLVRQATGSASTLPFPTADVTGTIAMSGTAGKVALVNGTTALTGACPTTNVIDFVGFGSATTCAEGTPTANLSNSTGLIRNDNGCSDTNNNLADFTIVTVGPSDFLPRNSASTPVACGTIITDCNNNGIDDAVDIAANPSLDCNTNGVIDSCELAGNDCDNNGVLDSCDIAANPALDANSNGIIDSCEGSSLASVIISEVVDGTLTSGLPKYVEITNLSTTTTVTFGINDSIKLYSNGATTAGNTYALNGVTLSPGQSYVIANDGGGTTLPPAGWVQAYGVFNPPNAYGSPAFINGNDALTIERSGTIIDAFGTVGVDGFGTAWDYTDSFARRKPGVCAANGTFTVAEWVFGGPNGLEQPLVNANLADSNVATLWINNLQHLTSPGSHANNCFGTINDCNGNGIDDSIDIASGTPDCNGNGVPDSCDIANGAPDCNSNGIPDTCDILSGNFPDNNATGIPDVCDAFQADCNGNFIEDAEDILSGASQDCNANGIPDECEPLMVVDANNNGIADLCEGAHVVEAYENATVRPSGVRTAPNGQAFFNIQGSELGANSSYGGTRFDITALVAQFDAQFGEGNWHVDRAYVRLVQSNAAFSATGDVSIQHTSNDTADFVPTAAAHAPFYADFASDYPDAAEALLYTYTVVANGEVENHLVFDASAANLPGGDAIAGEINSAQGPLTVLFRDATATVSATYAGLSNNTYLGPTLVVFPAEGGSNPCPPCAADYDNNGGVDGGDLGAFFADFETGELCADVDGNGGVDGGDLGFFFFVFELGGCE